MKSTLNGGGVFEEIEKEYQEMETAYRTYIAATLPTENSIRIAADLSIIMTIF